RYAPRPGSWPPSRPRPATPPAGSSCSTKRRHGARPRSPGPASHPTRTWCSGPGPARFAAPAAPPWSSAAASATTPSSSRAPASAASPSASPPPRPPPPPAASRAGTAGAGARSRAPAADYPRGALLTPPASWRGAFDLVVEIYTVQPLHGTARTTAVSMLPRLVAPGGTLLIIAHATEQSAPGRDPASFPWPLTRAEIDSAADLLHPVKIELLRDDETPPTLRWRAEFNRKA